MSTMKSISKLFLLLLLALSVAIHVPYTNASDVEDVWAVLVDTSRYYFNYRHSSDVMGFYQNLRDSGIPDSQIIVLLADDASCNPRNPFAGQMYINSRYTHNLITCDQWVDFKGRDLTPQFFLDILTGRDGTAERPPMLQSGPSSNVFIYMNGHSGDQFFKFHDTMELSAQDFGQAIADMAILRRFKELLVMLDTCEASTIWEGIPTEIPTRMSPLEGPLVEKREWWERLVNTAVNFAETIMNLVTEDDGREHINEDLSKRPGTVSAIQVNATILASSNRGQNSYSDGFDPIVGLSLRDAFPKRTYNYIRERFLPSHIEKNASSSHSVLDWIKEAGAANFQSGVLGVRTDLSPEWRLSDNPDKTVYAGPSNNLRPEVRELLAKFEISEFWNGWGRRKVSLSND